ncbi:MAG: alkaline phosphatase family protein [Blastococcus sp.]
MTRWRRSSSTWWCSCRRTTPPTTTSPRCGRGGRTSRPAGRCSPTRRPRTRRTPAPPTRGGCTRRDRGRRTPPAPSSTTSPSCPTTPTSAATGAFVENHCSGFGTNSTPNHLLLVGGQTPTLRNPPRTAPPPLWDMPSLPGHAADHGLSWRVYTGASGYPVSFYTQLQGSPNIVGSDQIVAEAADLPALSLVWHDPPYDEHPVADVSLGQDKVWQAVDAIVAAGLWNSTVFFLTWDDWVAGTTTSSHRTSSTHRTASSWPTGRGCRC